MKRNKILSVLSQGPALAAALAAAVHVYITIYLGDDIIFGKSSFDSSGFLLTIKKFWLNCNCRFGDLTNHIWLYHVPRSVTAILCGVMTYMVFFLLGKITSISSSKRPLLYSLLMAGGCAVLPWWDSPGWIVVKTNYVWAIALGAMSVWVITCFTMKKGWWLLYCPIALISGFGHEITGMPIMFGIIAWMLWVNKAALTRNKKIIISLLFIGCLLSVSSPGSYNRISWDVPFNGGRSRWMVNFITSTAGIALLAETLFLYLFNRSYLRKLCKSMWLPYAIIAITSMPFAIMGNILGRPGWCVQYFGIAAIFFQLSQLNIGRRLSHKWANLIAASIFIFFTAQWVVTTFWQTRVDIEERKCFDAWLKDPAKPIEVKYQERDYFPLWLMKKVDTNRMAEGYTRYLLNKEYGQKVKIKGGG